MEQIPAEFKDDILTLMGQVYAHSKEIDKNITQGSINLQPRSSAIESSVGELIKGGHKRPPFNNSQLGTGTSVVPPVQVQPAQEQITTDPNQLEFQFPQATIDTIYNELDRIKAEIKSINQNIMKLLSCQK